MELWIRSQSRQTLIKAEKVFTEDEEVYATTNSEFNERIGVYKTKEKALEVLDEIQDELISTNFAPKIYEDEIMTCGSARVYEMPIE